MDVKSFINKFGWSEAQEIITGIPEKIKNGRISDFCWDMNTYKYLNPRKPRRSLVNLSDLKRYVDAYGLVQSYGGVDYLRFALEHSDICGTDELEQAIQLVESVDEND